MKVTFDTSKLTALGAKLDRIDEKRIEQAEVRAVNQVTQRTFTTARKHMIAGINLPDSYLRERMAVVLASESSHPTAHIRARYAHTGLGRYAPKALVRPSVTSGRGDSSRGIPAGLKSAGVSVEVSRGSRKAIPDAFMMPLRNGNGIGVFMRDPGAKKPRLLFGPSVYQLFRATIGNIQGEIRDDLTLTVSVALANVIKEAL